MNMVLNMLDFLLSILLDICPEVRLLGHTVILCQFLRNSHTVSTVTAHFLFLPALHTGSSFSASALTFDTFWVLTVLILKTGGDVSLWF